MVMVMVMICFLTFPCCQGRGSSIGMSFSDRARGLVDDDEVVAFLEVDGPTHYRWDGQLRRKDKLKEAMYLAVSRKIVS